MNFVKTGTPMALLRTQFDIASGKNLRDGNVQFTPCDATIPGVWSFDPSQTYTVPSPVYKDLTVAFDFGGLFTEAGAVSNVHLDVLWDNVPLHKEDHP